MHWGAPNTGVLHPIDQRVCMPVGADTVERAHEEGIGGWSKHVQVQGGAWCQSWRKGPGVAVLPWTGLLTQNHQQDFRGNPTHSADTLHECATESLAVRKWLRQWHTAC
jgi:hypothetical protein